MHDVVSTQESHGVPRFSVFRTFEGEATKQVHLLTNRSFDTLAAFARDRIFQDALEQLPRVLKIFFGVGSGDGDASECFVEDCDDAALFGK